MIVACGTSYHAGLIGRYAIEEWARLPVEMDVASEYRYRNPVVGPGDLVIGISQSGETADTLAAMRLARERGATVLAVTNVMGSPGDARRRRRALHARRARDRRRRDEDVRLPGGGRCTCSRCGSPSCAGRCRASELRGARRRPQAAAALHRGAARERLDEPVEASPRPHHEPDFFLYLGRHVGLPVALEGALKLKEISYIATDAYAAGEMKHGPIALLDEATPVVVRRDRLAVLDKVVSNMQEVRARGAHVIAVATDGTPHIGEHAEEVVRVPDTDWMLQPLLAIVPLQLLAYRIARLRGLNVDQPRNLAKTVTVE